MCTIKIVKGGLEGFTSKLMLKDINSRCTGGLENSFLYQK